MEKHHLHKHVIKIVVDLVFAKLSATVLSIAFSPHENDAAIRGYVAWTRDDQCGTHQFIVHIEPTMGGWTIAGVPHGLNFGNFNLTEPDALIDAHERNMDEYPRTIK